MYIANCLAVRSMAQVCGSFVAGIAGSNPTVGLEFGSLCLFVLCRYRPL